MRSDGRDALRRLASALLALGAAATLATLAGLLLAPEAALKGWLAAAMMWGGLPVGALGFLMMMHLIAGVWDDELMVQMEGAVLLLPLAALAFVPLLLGIGTLFHWAGAPQETPFRAAYLSADFLMLRTLGALAVLSTLAALLILRPVVTAPVAAFGLIVYTLIASMLGIDWLMTLDAHFHSSIFGLYVLSIQMCVALMCAALISFGGGAGARQPTVVGGLMLASLLVWAYLAFMQYFIVWSGNLPPGVRWYQARGGAPWTGLFWAVALLHAVPGMLLLLMPVLRRARVLAWLACAVLAGKMLEMAWLVLPSGEGEGSRWTAALLLATAMAGLGGIFGGALILAFCRRVRARAPAGPEEAS